MEKSRRIKSEEDGKSDTREDLALPSFVRRGKPTRSATEYV